MLSVFYILKSDNIQDKVVQSIINKISEKYNIDISVDSSELSFEKGITLNNILLNDHQKDTLVYVKNLKTNLRSLEKLIEGDVRISNLYLNGVILKIKSNPTDKTNNLNFFLENINSKKDSSKISPIISVSSFKIENSDVIIVNSGSSYQISKLEIKDFFAGPDFVDTGKIDGEFETSNFNSFSFKSKSSEYLGCSFSINDFTFISDQIQFDGGIKYSYAYKDFFDYSNNSKISSKVKISNFHPAKLDSRFDSSSKVSGELELLGSLNSIDIKNLKLDFGFSKLIAEVNVLNYFSKRENSFSGFISFDSLDINDLNSFTTNKIVQLNYFKYQKIKKFFLGGTYRSDRWNLNSNIESSLGNFQLNYINGKSDDLSNSVSINIRNLDANEILFFFTRCKSN